MLSNAGEHIEVLKNHIQDQAQFANLCRNIIADLGLPIDLDDPMDGETNLRISRRSINPMNQIRNLARKTWPWTKNLKGMRQRMETETVEMDAHADMEEVAGEADPDESAMPLPDDTGRITVDHNYQAFHRKVR